MLPMLLRRWFIVAASALPLVPTGFAILLFLATTSPAAAVSAICEDVADVTVLPSPVAPWKGAPLRVMAVSEKPIEIALSLMAPDGSRAVTSSDRHGGGPYSWFAEIAAPAAGTWHATLAFEHASAGCDPITRDIVVTAGKPAPIATPSGGSGKYAVAGIVRRNPCSRRGSRSSSTHRQIRICRGRCGMRCCETSHAIFCSTIWDAAKTA